MNTSKKSAEMTLSRTTREIIRTIMMVVMERKEREVEKGRKGFAERTRRWALSSLVGLLLNSVQEMLIFC